MKEIERIKRNGSPSLPINSGKIPSEKKSSYLRRREEEKRQACVYAHAICTERKRERGNMGQSLGQPLHHHQRTFEISK